MTTNDNMSVFPTPVGMNRITEVRSDAARNALIEADKAGVPALGRAA